MCVRESFVVAARLEHGDRLAQALERPLRISSRRTPELEVVAREREPGACDLVVRARARRCFVEHLLGGFALAVPRKRIGQDRGDRKPVRRLGREQRCSPTEESGTRHRVVLVVCAAAGCGQVPRRIRRQPHQLGRTGVDLDLSAVCGLEVVTDELVGFDTSPARTVDEDGRDPLV